MKKNKVIGPLFWISLIALAVTIWSVIISQYLQ
jgi:hypothetical protein